MRFPLTWLTENLLLCRMQKKSANKVWLIHGKAKNTMLFYQSLWLFFLFLSNRDTDSKSSACVLLSKIGHGLRVLWLGKWQYWIESPLAIRSIYRTGNNVNSLAVETITSLVRWAILVRHARKCDWLRKRIFPPHKINSRYWTLSPISWNNVQM